MSSSIELEKSEKKKEKIYTVEREMKSWESRPCSIAGFTVLRRSSDASPDPKDSKNYLGTQLCTTDLGEPQVLDARSQPQI